MSGEFKDKFDEIGALWPTKSGKGFSGKLKIGSREWTIVMYANQSENTKAPKWKIYVPKDEPEQKPTTTGDDPVPF